MDRSRLTYSSLEKATVVLRLFHPQNIHGISYVPLAQQSGGWPDEFKRKAILEFPPKDPLPLRGIVFRRLTAHNSS